MSAIPTTGLGRTVGSLDADELRRRLRRAARPPAVASEPHDEPPDPTRLIPAAVLVPLVLGPIPGVLLTRRVAHLSSHAGQVSFPGGRIDAADPSAEAAALREAHEEVGLDPARVEILGRLDDYVTGTGYRITPVLGLLPSGMALQALALQLSPHEVDAVFELPLSVLLDPSAPRRRRAALRERAREFWVWPHPEHHIWGATAAMLMDLAMRLRRPLDIEGTR